ncbi:MAG TPA: M48 family metalloprotease [Thermoanaerobaculia bacterium]|jgi:predicted Zn-dependent protease
MRRTAPFRAAVALATLLLVSVSCVSTRLPPISSQGDAFKPLRDERELWRQSRAEEDKLLGSVQLYGDARLEAYLDRVVARLNPPAMVANPAVRYQVRVIEDPTLNAFSYPHGSIYIHTGLLARLDNEDELATVLGHEMTHVEDRHMLRYQRSAHNKEIGLTIAAVTAEIIVEAAADIADSHGSWGKAAAIDVFGNLLVDLGLQLAFVASVNGYGRGLEAEADAGGFAKMAAAGYDLRQAPRVYLALLDDQGEAAATKAFFFGSHPRLRERVEATRRYLAQHPGKPSADRSEADEAFIRHLQPVVREDARLNLERGRLKLAESELAKARAWDPEDPGTYLLKGRLRLAQAAAAKGPEERDRLRGVAEDSFREAIELDASFPAPHRELGLLLYERKDFHGACTQLRRSADLDPKGDESGRIQGYLTEMEKAGSCG